MILVKGGYTPDVIVVEHGKPVHLNFCREETAACSEMVLLPDFDKSARLPTGDVVAIEFLPDAPDQKHVDNRPVANRISQTAMRMIDATYCQLAVHIVRSHGESHPTLSGKLGVSLRFSPGMFIALSTNGNPWFDRLEPCSLHTSA